jgi:hypothetical protein
MPIYTVHESPLRIAGASADPVRFVFVRDGFYVWAFLLTPLWMLWHRLWLVLIGYVVLSAVLDGLLRFAGASTAVVAFVGVLISLLIGLEGGPLRRFTLRRRRWRNAGLVSGYDLEDAERRFFDTWVRRAPTQNDSPSAAPSVFGAPMPAHTAETPGVIGLFPEPGAPR